MQAGGEALRSLNSPGARQASDNALSLLRGCRQHCAGMRFVWPFNQNRDPITSIRVHAGADFDDE
jgi:hypothetical protein